MKISLRQIFELLQSLSIEEIGRLYTHAAHTSPNISLLLQSLKASSTTEVETDTSLFFQQLEISEQESEQLLIDTARFVLRFLRSQTNTSLQQVSNAVEDIKILFQKGQLNLGLAILEHAKKIAYENEYWTQLDKLLVWEKVLKNKTASDFELKVLSRERSQIKQKLISFHEYSILMMKVLNLKGGFIKQNSQLQKAKALLAHPLLQNENTALSFKSKIDYHYILSLIHHCLHNYMKAKAHAKRMVELFQNNKDYTEKNINYYTSVINNYAYATLSLEKYDETLEVSQELKQLTQKYTSAQKLNLHNGLLIRAYHIEIQVYKKQLKFEKATSLIPKILEVMNILEQPIPTMHQTGILYEVAETLFFTKDYQTALTYVQQIYQYERDKTYVDAQIMSRLLELLIYVELGDKIMLNKRLEAVKTYLKSEKAYFRYEVLFMDLMHELLLLENIKEKNNLYTEHLMLFRSIENLIEKDAYLDMTVWLESKLAGKDFIDTLKERDSSQKTYNEIVVQKKEYLKKGFRAKPA